MNDKIWANQSLLYHKDAEYNTDSTLDMSLTTNTSDFRNFSAVGLNIAISSFSSRKNQILNLQNAITIRSGFQELEKMSIDFEKAYKIQPEKILILGKKGGSMFILKIKHSENDIISIAFNYDIMKTIMTIIDSFIESYLKLSIDLPSRFLLSEILYGTNGVKDSVMTIPSSIINSVGDVDQFISDKHALVITPEKTKDVEELIDNFDKFLGKDMENISIDIPPKVNEPYSKVVAEPTTYLNKLFPSLRDFENYIFSVSSSPNTFKEITSRFSTIMKSGNFLPEIQIADLKSYMYISKSMYMHHLRQNTDFETQIPASSPIIKYVGRGDEENILLAYDLLTINLYIKLFRSRIELKDSNSMNNGSLFYLALRSFTDILVFSFIENIDKNMIATNIIERFKYFSSINFFNEYELTLHRYNMSIDENDIKHLVVEMADKVLGKTLPIGNLHDQYYKKGLLNVPYDNIFTSDAIMNVVVPLQIMALSDNEITDKVIDALTKETSTSTGMTNEIFKFFGTSDSTKSKSHNRETNVLKSIKYFSEEIPFKYREQFIGKIQNIKDINIDLSVIEHPYAELGENVLKSIYVWNEYDKKLPYDEFRKTMDNLTLQKNDIIVKFNGVPDTLELGGTDDNWFA